MSPFKSAKTEGTSFKAEREDYRYENIEEKRLETVV